MTHEEETEAAQAARLSLWIAIATLIATAAFVVFALSGADLCIWCGAAGR